MPPVAGSVARTLARAHGAEREIDVVVPRDLLDQRVRTQRTFNVVVGSVAVLSLLVGGIGIMNTMLTSVLERTQEIGLRRVVGATARNIGVQFLTESLLVTMTGGTVDVAVGVVTSYVITAYAAWSMSISSADVGLAFGVSAVVGVAFGIYPALRAARLQPAGCRAVRVDRLDLGGPVLVYVTGQYQTRAPTRAEPFLEAVVIVVQPHDTPRSSRNSAREPA